MPSADCQACVVGVGSLQHAQGRSHEPFGTCKNCYSLACGHHGHRDWNQPEFICVECDPNLLAASAASIPSAPTYARNLLLTGYHLHALPAELWRIESLDDFERRRPYYGEDFFAKARQSRLNFARSWPDDNLRVALADLPDEAQELVATAGLIIRLLEIPPERVAEHLLQISEFVV